MRAASSLVPHHRLPGGRCQGMIVVPVGERVLRPVPFEQRVYIFLVQYAGFRADERVVNFEGGTGGQLFFALRLVIDDILVAGGIVHDERAGEPGKMGGEFVADTYVRRVKLPVPPLSRAPEAQKYKHFFSSEHSPYSFFLAYFSDSGPEKYSGRITVSLKRERRRKQYWRLADFQEAAPARRF